MVNTVLIAGTGFFWLIAARFYTAEGVGFGSAIISVKGFIYLLNFKL
jgi:hypothetical protein